MNQLYIRNPQTLTKPKIIKLTENKNNFWEPIDKLT